VVLFIALRILWARGKHARLRIAPDLVIANDAQTIDLNALKFLRIIGMTDPGCLCGTV